ncbi:MAG TPA: helix-turn-helix transcriptional regulator [Acidobacteriota bacterium]|nr:helix-turn-helix transcriptional regulator [Acidobacteriota bacterium]
MRKKEEKFYAIGVVSKMFNIHQQTLRLYEREGLLKPARSDGNTRLYSDKDLERLELILNLSRDMGVNLAGVDIILNLRERMAEMQQQINEMVKFLKTELEKKEEPAAEAGQRGLVKSPAANLIRLSQFMAHNQPSRAKR